MYISLVTILVQTGSILNACNNFVIIGLNVAGKRFKFGCVILCSVYLTNLNIMPINIVKLYTVICRHTASFFTNYRLLAYGVGTRTS